LGVFFLAIPELFGAKSDYTTLGDSRVSLNTSFRRKTRDKSQAASSFDETLSAKRRSSDTEKAAEELVKIIPPDVISLLESRADLCWTGYRTVLGGVYLPDEVDRATDAVQACVCRELRRIYKLNGDIPPKWKEQWDRFKCQH
jgi:hypothetical protein